MNNSKIYKQSNLYIYCCKSVIYYCVIEVDVVIVVLCLIVDLYVSHKQLEIQNNKEKLNKCCRIM